MSKPVTNPTDTNKASEDELRGRIVAIFANSIGDVVDDTDDVIAIIRTEKLKLLAEVRERVIGEDFKLNSFEIPVFEAEFVITSVTQQNRLRADQRISLTKLEAEL